MKTLRPYQREASVAITKSWNEGVRAHIVVVATGGGKTVIAADAAGRVAQKGKVLFLANRNELCLQPMETFSRQLNYIPGLEKADSYAPLEAQIVIGSVQTLSRQARLDRFPRDHFRFIFADECHTAVSNSWKRIFEHFNQARICGITATPFRSDAKSLTDVFQAEAYRKDLFSLVEDGYLVDPDHVDRLKTAISLAQVRVRQTTEGKDFDVNDAADAILPYFDEIAKELAERHSQKRILAFLPLVASSQKFVAACRRAGLNAVHVDGEDPQRDQKLRSFKDGQIQLLSNSNLLHTGVDMPSCDCTLNLRPTKSKVLYAQIIGRSTRTVPGLIDGLETAEARKAAIAGSAKPRAYIIDPLWLSEEHDLVTPAFMIAEDEEMANEMGAAAGESYSLRSLHSQIQAQREEVIRRRLQAMANFQDGRVNAQWFGASIHDPAITNYEPVYTWEKAKPTRFSQRLLSAAGIDPESVASEGLARQVLRAIGRRRNRQLPEIRRLAALANSLGVDSARIWTATYKDVQESNQ